VYVHERNTVHIQCTDDARMERLACILFKPGRPSAFHGVLQRPEVSAAAAL